MRHEPDQMTLPDFVDRMDLDIANVDGQIIIPAASAGLALVIKTILEKSVPGYWYKTDHYPVWGNVVLVTPIPDDLAFLEKQRQSRTSKPVGPWQLHSVQPKLVEKEKIPILVDALDVQLAAMIGEAWIDE